MNCMRDAVLIRLPFCKVQSADGIIIKKELLYVGEYDPIGRIYVEWLCFSITKTTRSRITNYEEEKKRVNKLKLSQVDDDMP